MLNKLRHRAEDEKGFTLIELLVVILIIGILAAIAIPAFLNQKGKAYDSNAKSDARTAATAEETYFTDNNALRRRRRRSGVARSIEPTLNQARRRGQREPRGRRSCHRAVRRDGRRHAHGGQLVRRDDDVEVRHPVRIHPLARRHRVSAPATSRGAPNASGCKIVTGTSGNGTW